MPINLAAFCCLILCISSIMILLTKLIDCMDDRDWKYARWIPVAAAVFMVWISCAFSGVVPEKKVVNVSIIDNTAICIWDNKALNLNNKFKKQFSEGPLTLVYFPAMSYGISFDTVKLDTTSEMRP